MAAISFFRSIRLLGLLALGLICTQTFAQADTAQARQVFTDVNQQLAKLKKTLLKAKRPDVAYTSEVAIWSDDTGVRKLETTDRDDSGDVITEYYYAGGQLMFVYQAVKGFNDANKQITRHEERQYFQAGKMFKWLSGMDKSAIAPTAAEFISEAKTRLNASAFFLKTSMSGVSWTQPTSTVAIDKVVKKTLGTVTALSAGDVACYVSLKDDQGMVFKEMAEFDICEQKPSLLGKRVELSYMASSVMSDACQGDPSCKKTRRVILISQARVIPAECAPAKGAATVKPDKKPACP
jgi:hypothetical protein